MKVLAQRLPGQRLPKSRPPGLLIHRPTRRQDLHLPKRWQPHPDPPHPMVRAEAPRHPANQRQSPPSHRQHPSSHRQHPPSHRRHPPSHRRPPRLRRHPPSHRRAPRLRRNWISRRPATDGPLSWMRSHGRETAWASCWQKPCFRPVRLRMTPVRKVPAGLPSGSRPAMCFICSRLKNVKTNR